MGFGDLSSLNGVKALNEYLARRSYVDGFVPSQADVVVAKAVASHHLKECVPHAQRWYKHISSYSDDEKKMFPGAALDVNQYGPKLDESSEQKKDDDDDDDFDLFGDEEEEEETEEEKREREEKLAAYHAKKSAKPAVIAKSSLLLDVKPWDDETDMAQLEANVRTVEMDGLIWGQSKLVPVAYGVKKLSISAVIEDAKVSTDDLTDKIKDFEDYVQSVDIAAFNKI